MSSPAYEFAVGCVPLTHSGTGLLLDKEPHNIQANSLRGLIESAVAKGA